MTEPTNPPEVKVPPVQAKPLRPAIGEEAYNGLSKWGKLKESVLQNKSHDGYGKLALRGAGAVVGIGSIFIGAKNVLRYAGILSPKQDEQGKDQTVGFGTLALGTLQVAGGATLGLASLMAGGKGHAIGAAR